MVERWKTLPWMRRFWVVLGGSVFLVCFYLFGIENLRGTIAMRNAKARAAEKGFPINMEDRLEPEVEEDSLNFAECRRIVDRFSSFGLLEPGFRGLNPHADHDSASKRRFSWRTGKVKNIAWSVSPRANTERGAADQILTLLAPWSEDFDEIERLSHATYCNFENDWSQDVKSVELFSASPIYRWFGLRSYCFLKKGDTEAAVRDVETLCRVAAVMNERPLWFHVSGFRRFTNQTNGVIWAGLNEGAFSVAQIERLREAISNTRFREFMVQMFINEESYALRFAEQKYFSMARRSMNWPDFPPDYWPESVLASYHWDNQMLESAERLTYTAFPSGWFKLYQTDKLDRLMDVVHTSPSMLEMYRFCEKGNAKFSSYQFVWTGGEFGDAYLDVAAEMITIATELELALFALESERERLVNGNISNLIEKAERRPVDHWSGRPMNIFTDESGKPVLYSVGRDKTDDGGLPVSGSGKGDLVWQYSLPK